MNIAIMDNNGIIEDFDSIEEAIENIDRVRNENDDIVGDLKVVEIHHIDN